MTAVIPDKLFFKIGEVAKIVSLRPSVLRYWELEFEVLKPTKSRAGQRLYTKKDIELIVEIKKLLYAEKLTIEGARKKIAGSVKKSKPVSTGEEEGSSDRIRNVLSEVREDLVRLRNSLQL